MTQKQKLLHILGKIRFNSQTYGKFLFQKSLSTKRMIDFSSISFKKILSLSVSIGSLVQQIISILMYTPTQIPKLALLIKIESSS